MPPVDSTPRGDEMVRRLPERKFPEPKPQGSREDAEMGQTPFVSEKPERSERDHGAATDISRRPALPEHPERMAADIEDEEADPVIDTGPGIADGMKSFRKQKG
ncbi:MAG TPA: hypothetical protein VK996_14875 [Ramlibacter sp.]|nr:hypothetical protein [Ramlibacter sp.]